jgi:hypothetical protein
MLKRADRLVTQPKKPDSLEALFAEFIRHKFASFGTLLPKSGSLLEMKAALNEHEEARKETHPAEGEAGEQAEANTEAIAENLIVLLTERFGELAPHWQKRIRGARLIALKRYFKRATMAPDLRSIFFD